MSDLLPQIVPFRIKANRSSAYVVFPGNVGEEATLRDLVASWAKVDDLNDIPAMQYKR